MTRFWWHLIRLVARLCTWAYYKRFRVENVERIPSKGPVLIVGNHPNALVDAGVVLRAVPRPVSFAAKHTLFDMPVMGWMLRKLGAVPVYRPRDRTGETRKNLKMFSAFVDHFRGGGAAAIFPEGMSHLDAELKEVKSGPARIALDAETATDFGLGLVIVPVGLHYEPRLRFRGEVYVRVGEPFDIADLAGEARHPAIREVQRRISESLSPLMLHLDRVELEPMVRRVVEIYEERGRSQPGGKRPPPKAALVHTAGACLNHFLAADPSAVEAVRQRLADYEQLAHEEGIGDEAVEMRRRPWRSRLRACVALLRTVIGLPIFLVGFLAGFLPYRITERLARKTARKQGRVTLPFARIVAGFLVFGIFWALVCTGVYLGTRSIVWTVCTFFVLVPAGFYARYYAERTGAWKRRLWSLLPFVGSRVARVSRARDELLLVVDELVDRYGVASAGES